MCRLFYVALRFPNYLLPFALPWLKISGKVITYCCVINTITDIVFMNVL